MFNEFTENIKAKVVFDPKDLTKKHEKHSDWKKHVIAFIDDPDFCDYYTWFLKKRYNLFLVKPIRGVHFTVINDRLRDDVSATEAKYKEFKNLYNGKVIDIEYSLDVRTDGKHWWFRARSNDAMFIRQAIGLEAKPYWGFHITVGRAEGRAYEVAHSKYIHGLIKTFGNEFK
jgi:hypothetical protein